MPYGSKHIPEERLKEMLDELQAHFGEPVRPVSEYCQAFYDWHKAIIEKVKRVEAGEERESMEGYYEGIRDALNTLVIPIRKSNYLWRRIYGDGFHRTEMCPEHKGRWSGYSHDRACDYGCNHGYDITGWLPELHEFVEKPEDVEPVFEDGKVVKMGIRYGPRDQCYRCGGTQEKGQHV